MNVFSISPSEIDRRQDLVRTIMADTGVDAVVIHAKEDWIGGYMRWLTGIPAQNGYPRTVVLPRNGPLTVVEMGAFGTNRGPQPWEYGTARVLGTPSFHSVHYTVDYDTRLVEEVLRRMNVRSVGVVCPSAMPYGIGRMLAEGFDVVDISDPVDLAKAIKSPEEIALIRQCAALQDAVWDELLTFARPGKTDREVASHAEAVGRKLGSDQGIVLGLSARMGQPSRFMGRPWQERTIEQGDHMSVLVEVNGPGGMYLEIARTMTFGPAQDHILQSFELVKAAQDYTLSLMVPGADPAAIAAAHDRWMTEHGAPPETRLYAHGQGCDMVERPLIRHDESMRLAENMCLAVHPGFDDGRLFAVICDNYLIGPNGVGDCLHKTPKTIFQL